MTVRIGINGFGRIGRCTLAHIIESGRDDIEVAAINATGPLETNAHLLRYDSVHGRFPHPVSVGEAMLDAGRGPMRVFSTRSPVDLDWDGIDVVLECTGAFNSGAQGAVHLERGARRVLISAPAGGVDRTVVYGVNHSELNHEDLVVSNGSCTTNCLAPLARVLDEGLGIEHGLMTTVHSYTGDQPTLDRRHDDLYRARGAAISLIPTSTGAAKAIGEVLPNLQGRLDGAAIRVPTPNVSAVDLTFRAARDTTIDEVNGLLSRAATGAMRGIISYETEPKVSVDFNHDSHSCNFAADQTRVMDSRLVRVMAWYDNEWGFSCRMADVAAAMGRLN